MFVVTHEPQLTLAVVFVGGWDSASIHCFDLRAKAVLYELSCGNNGVQSLAFDELTSTLLAATTRFHSTCACCATEGWLTRQDRAIRKVDKTGRVIKPKPKCRRNYDSEDDSDSDLGGGSWSEEVDEADDFDYRFGLGRDAIPPRWPRGASHDEASFGHVYDAGRSSLRAFVRSPVPALTA